MPPTFAIAHRERPSIRRPLFRRNPRLRRSSPRRGANALNGSELFEQGGFAPLTDIGELVQNALRNPPQPEFGIIGVGEAMRFIPHALQQFKRAAVVGKPERQFLSGRKTSSNSLANPITGRWVNPSFCSSAHAALNWPLPPSIRIKSGKGVGFFPGPAPGHGLFTPRSSVLDPSPLPAHYSP